jgi:hypothetical protein
VRPIPKTYLSLHDVSDLRAYVSPTLGGSLELNIETPEGTMMIMLFLQSSGLAEVLATAINTVMADKAPPPAVACPREAAAYKSQEEYWTALKRDLDARPIEAHR